LVKLPYWRHGDPWARRGKGGHGLQPGDLAYLLRAFGIAPGTIRLTNAPGRGSTAKGYKREWFEDDWSRFLAEDDDADVTV
jgi:uncharacterized protein DUF3631